MMRGRISLQPSARTDAAARNDPRLRVLPTRIERLAGLVEVEHERGVVRRDRLAFARLAIDLDRDDPFAQRSRRQQVIDSHAEVLVEVAGAVVPPGESTTRRRMAFAELV